MTILAMAQTCAARLQLPVPSTFVASTENNIVLLRNLMLQTVLETRNEFPWAELQKEFVFTLNTSTNSYPLPDDFNRFQFETLWNRTQHWPLIGPLNAQQWQVYKSGLVATVPRQRFRVKGWGINQFFIDPTPTASEDDQTCVFEYISQTAIRPKTWTASTVWTGIQYCSYDGNIYVRANTGVATTGTTPPTWTSGSSSDGSITWTYTNTPYDSFIDDSDEIILDRTIIQDETVWRFKRERGLDYEDERVQCENQKDLAKSRLCGAGVLSLRWGTSLPMMIGPWSYPVENYQGIANIGFLELG